MLDEWTKKLEISFISDQKAGTGGQGEHRAAGGVRARRTGHRVTNGEGERDHCPGDVSFTFFCRNFGNFPKKKHFFSIDLEQAKKYKANQMEYDALAQIILKHKERL